MNPLTSNEFCGALLKTDPTSTTTGQCSEASPQTFGQLKNFKGVRCGAGERCRAKRLCSNPDPAPGVDSDGNPCAPQTHYYFDVASDSANPDFTNATPLPAGSVFTVDGASSQAERDAYLGNPFLRAVCAPQ
jgi:hypothetical protein